MSSISSASRIGRSMVIMPLAASTATRGRRPPAPPRTNDRMWRRYSAATSPWRSSPGRAARGRSPAAIFCSMSAMPWSPETGRASWRLELEAVVLGGVMAGGGLHPPGGAFVADGEVVHRRGGEPDVEHVEAGLADALDQGRREPRAAAPHVARHHHRVAAGAVLGVEDVLESEADPVRYLLVDLRRVDAAHVIGLEDSRHRSSAR